MKTIKFILRNDIYFHDHPAFKKGKGRKMTASDVVYSFQRIMDPKLASPGSWIFQNRIDSIEPFTALNDSVFILKLKQPFVQILGVLTNKYCSIVPQEAVEYADKPWKKNPCGTGPFQFFSWAEHETIIVKKNPHYFEKDTSGKSLPYLDGIVISLNGNKATEFLSFRQGKIDFINDIDPTFKDEIFNKSGKLRKEWEGKIIHNTGPYLHTEYLGILMQDSKNNILQHKSIRQAISYGIDKKKLIMYLRNSVGKAGEQGFIPSGLPGYDSNSNYGYLYNPEKARALLHAVGYGKSIKPIIHLSTVPAYADLASFIAKELKLVGIELNIDVVPKSLLLSQMAKQKVGFFRGSWIADYPDAENFLSVFYSKNPAPPNYTRYKNPLFDQLYESCMMETDLTKRIALYRKMDSLVMEDAPVIPLWYDQVIHLVQPHVNGFSPHPLNILELRRARFKNN
jgi:peptide/nickel transport system substrate-binding protein